MATTRNSSIEMLRLFAIFGIVIMHVTGPLLSDAFGINSIWIQIENSIFNCGVSVFVLISGYFGIRRSSFKILLLELSALFYSLVASLLTLFVSGGGYSQLIKALLPFSTNEFWFFTCYLLILLFSPYLNEFVDSSSQQQFKKLLTALCLVFVLLPSVLYFHPLGSGKNVLNLVFVYLLGGYLRRFNVEDRVSDTHLCVIFLGSFISIFILDSILSKLTGSIHIPFARDCSIFVLLEAVSIFLIFKKHYFTSGLINKVSGHVFAVYLFEGAFRTCLVPMLVNVELYYSLPIWPLISIFVTLLTMAACILIDLPVNWLIKKTLSCCHLINSLCDRVLEYI